LFFVQGDGHAFELVELVRPSSNEIALDLILEAVVECRGDHLGIPELSLQCGFLE